MEEQPQLAKRRRRPSVRLGEIGYAAPYDASSLWIEAPRQRKKQQAATSAEVLSTGKPGVKPPRIRPLEHLAAETAVIEEEWCAIEPRGVPLEDEPKLVGDGPLLKEQPQGKVRSSFTPRKGNSKQRGRVPGGGRLGWTLKEASLPVLPPNADSPRDDEDDEKDYEDEEEEEKGSPPEEAPISAETSSDSEELLGSDLKGDEEDLPADDSGNGASDGSEDGGPGANPNSHGDELQGAIEDGPGQLNGKSFTARQGERRSGRHAASRVKTNRDLSIRDRDTASLAAIKDSGIAPRDSASREIAGEPSSGRFQLVVANGTTIVTPNSSTQREMLSAGVSGWLQDLGLGKYSELFELNEVDTEVLPLLTFDDLREMGVDAVGARRKMFHGIQELGLVRGM